MNGEGQRFRCLVPPCDHTKSYSLTTLYEHLSYHCKEMGYDNIFEYKCRNCKGAFFTNRMFMVAHKKQHPTHQIARCEEVDLNNIPKKLQSGVDQMNNVLLRKMFEPVGNEHIPRRVERSQSRGSVMSTYYPKTPYARSPGPSRATTPSNFLRQPVHPDMSNDYANASTNSIRGNYRQDPEQQKWKQFCQQYGNSNVREEVPVQYGHSSGIDSRSVASGFQATFSSNRDRHFGNDDARNGERGGGDGRFERGNGFQNQERSGNRGDGDRGRSECRGYGDRGRSEVRRGQDDRDDNRGGDRYNRNTNDFRGGREGRSGGAYNEGGGDRNRDDIRGNRDERNDSGGFRGRRDSFGGDSGRGDNGGFRGRGCGGGGFRGRGGGRGGYNRNSGDNQSRYGSPSRGRNNKDRSRSRSPQRSNQAVNRSYSHSRSRSRSRSGSPPKQSQKNNPTLRNEAKKNERHSYSRSPQRSP